MKIEPVDMPEFGLELNMAVCRNPMCRNFGVDMDVEFDPEKQKSKTSARYSFRLNQPSLRVTTGWMQCQECLSVVHSLPSNEFNAIS